MNDNTRDQMLVLVDLDHNAARVRDLGFKAESVAGKNVGGLVLSLKDSGLTVVSMLNGMSNKDAEDIAAYAHIPLIAINEGQTAIAFDAEDNSILGEVLKDAEQKVLAAKIDSDEHFLKLSGVHSSMGIAMDIASGAFVRENVPTGIKGIDEKIGGFPRGAVTTIGAISSAGKTSLCSQIADNWARSGRPVLFCTLEQSRYELAVMSIVRIIGSKGYNNGHPVPICHRDGVPQYPTRSWIQSGPKTWTPALKAKVMSAASEFSGFADKNLHFMELEDAPTIQQIRRAAEAVAKVHDGASPIIIIDYLQLLKPMNDRRDERTATNENMSAARRMARDLNTVVVLISALNRQSLSQGVTLSAFRESGGIEYGSDVVLGLQPTSMTEKLEKGGKEVTGDGIRTTALNGLIAEFRDAEVKECDLCVLKNRSGVVPKDGVHLKFDGRICCFFDANDARTEDDPRNDILGIKLD